MSQTNKIVRDRSAEPPVLLIFAGGGPWSLMPRKSKPLRNFLYFLCAVCIPELVILHQFVIIITTVTIHLFSSTPDSKLTFSTNPSNRSLPRLSELISRRTISGLIVFLFFSF